MLFNWWKIKRFFALALAFVVVANVSWSQEKKYKIGVIGFYNLENLFNTVDDPNKDAEFLPEGANHYTEAVYQDKLGKLSDVISQIGSESSPDGLSIMGCSEVENEGVIQDLINQPKLKERHYKIVHYDSPDERGIDVGLIYNPKYFMVKFSEPLHVEIKNDDGSPRPTRDVLYVYGLYNGEPLHILVNHWPSRRAGADASEPNRKAAARVNRDKLDSITNADPHAKIIIMGDLNDDPISPSVAKVLNAQGKKEDVAEGELYNPWFDFYKKGLGTLAYNDSWNLFDQILISEEFLHNDRKGFFYKDAHIFKKDFLIQKSGKYKGYPMRTYDLNKYIGGYSDHLPTYIVFVKEVK